MTTTSTENYLKAIRELRGADGRVTTCALARHLGLAPASVTNMMQRLAMVGFVDYVPYHGAALTSEGEREANAVSQKHEIIEQYLIASLGFDQAQAHVEAERLEHVVSSNLIHKMATSQFMWFSASGGSTGLT